MPQIKIDFHSNRHTTIELKVKNALKLILQTQEFRKINVEEAYTIYKNSLNEMVAMNAYEAKYSFPPEWVEGSAHKKFQVHHVGVLTDKKRLIASVYMDDQALDPVIHPFWR